MAAILKEESLKRGGKVFIVSRRPQRRSANMKTVGSTVGRSNVYHIPARSTDIPSTVNLGSILIWCGLRSSHFGSNKSGSVGVSFYQKLVLAFLVLMYVRWALIMCIPAFTSKPEVYQNMLGDLDHSSSTKAGRLFFRVQTLAVATMSLLASIFCYRHRRERKYFNWLKLFEVMRKRIKASDLRITEYMAIQVWKRAVFTMRLYRVWLAAFVVSLPVILVMQNKAKILSGDQSVTMGVILQSLWFYFVAAQVIGLMAMFRCVAHYFDIRMKKLMNDMRLMNERDKEMIPADRTEVLYSWLVEFNDLHVELDKFNRFWQFYFLVFYGIGFFLSFFEMCFFAVLYKYLSWTEWAVVGVCLALVVTVWVDSILQAARVSAQTHKLYALMNRFCLVPTHAIVQNKMDNFVKKFSSREHKIGFHCYRMFYVTQPFLYHVAFNTGSAFVLFIDSVITVIYPYVK